jgi:arginase
VLAGGCNSCLGTAAGAAADGVVWFDAHADFDDPDENLSGFFDVMALAMLTGRGWRALRETIPGHRPIPEGDVLLAGVRDLEPYQRARLEQSDLTFVPGAVDREPFRRELHELGPTRIYLHVDLDVLDTSVATANGYAAPGGPSLERLLECIRLCCEAYPVAAAALTAYDPTYDADDRTLAAARRIAAEIATAV